MKVVIDTNVLLTSLKKSSKNRPIFDALLNGSIWIAVTTDILLEYLEIISQKTNSRIASNVVQLLLNLSKTEKVEVKFKFDLVQADPDDNKFTDCVIASNAELLVTNDKHFKELQYNEFPKIVTMSDEEFLSLLSKLIQ